MSITAEALISQRKKNKLGSIARKHNGELVHFYDQGKDQRTKKDDLTSGGWCFAMSNYWLSYDDTADFWLWFETEESEQRLRAQMARQAIVKATLIAAKGSDKNPDFRWSEQYKQKIGFNADLENAARQDDRNLLKKILRNAGLNPMEEHYKWGDEASGYWRLAQIITTSPRTKFAIAYWYTGGGAHQTAGRLLHNRFIYMDPNLGEFSIPEDNISDFFFDLEYDYQLPRLDSFEVIHCS